MTQAWHERVVSGGGGALGVFARLGLSLAAVPYGASVRIWRRGYDRKPSRAQRVSVPVISVGNITTGGTGKTPLVVEIVRRLQSMDRRPAVVSRGYKSSPAGRSDELSLIARRVPGVPCVANPDRVAGAQQAIASLRADVIVLDDGFQHRRLRRDLDIVVIDATRPFGYERMLPRGYLREPLDGLARADLFVMTRCDQVSGGRLWSTWRKLEYFSGQRPVIAAVHRPESLRPLLPAPPHEDEAGDEPAFLVSAIGNPDAYQRTAESLGIEIRGHAAFADHHEYTAADVHRICTQAGEAGAGRIIVTEKDAVKLESLQARWTMPVLVVGVFIDFRQDGGNILDSMLKAALEGRNS